MKLRLLESAARHWRWSSRADDDFEIRRYFAAQMWRSVRRRRRTEAADLGYLDIGGESGGA